MHSSDKEAGRPLEILAIDDDPHILSQIRRILEKHGYDTLTATSGRAGLTLLDQESPDLVLLDLELADMDGLALLVQIKERHRHLPVMMLASISETAAVNALRMGADDYFSKPIIPDELVERVQHNLEKGQQARAQVELQKDLQRQLSALLSVREVAREASQAADLYYLLHRALEQTLKSLNLDAGIIFVSENGELIPLAYRGLPQPITSSLTRKRLTWEDPWLRPFDQTIGATITHGEKQQGGPLSRAVGYRFTAIVPLWTRGQRWGLLEVASKEERPDRQEDLELLTTMGQQVALALANAKLQEKAAMRVRELALLNEACLSLTSDLDLEQILTTVMLRTSDVIGVETGTLFLADEESGELVFRIVLGGHAGRILSRRIPKGRGIAGWVFEHGESLLVQDVNQDSRYYPEVDRNTGFQTRSVLCVPLQVRGETFGVIELINKTSGEFSNEELKLVESIAALTATAIAQNRLNEWTISFILVDPLTRLPNHRFLLELLEREAARSRRYSRTVSLLMIGVDRRLQLPEPLWRDLTSVLRKVLRQSDLPCRHRDGPFVILLPETGAEGCRILSQRIREEIRRAGLLEPGGNHIADHLRFGMATFPEDVKDPNDLLAKAEASLTKAWEDNR
jgi:diguanylate cyclase (GGDEF)-like protein